jgi:hypothetical protein
MKLLMELFSKKTALQVKLSCAKRALVHGINFPIHPCPFEISRSQGPLHISISFSTGTSNMINTSVPLSHDAAMPLARFGRDG